MSTNFLKWEYMNVLSGLFMLADEISSIVYILSNKGWIIKSGSLLTSIVFLGLPHVIRNFLIFIYILPDYISTGRDCFPKVIMSCLCDFVTEPLAFCSDLKKKKYKEHPVISFFMKIGIVIISLPFCILSFLAGIIYLMPYGFLVIILFILFNIHSLYVNLGFILRIPYFRSIEKSVISFSKYKRSSSRNLNRFIAVLIYLGILEIVTSTFPMLFLKSSINSQYQDWGFINTSSLILGVVNIVYHLFILLMHMNKNTSQHIVIQRNGAVTVIQRV